MENSLVKNSIKSLINLEPELAKKATLEEYISLIFLKNVKIKLHFIVRKDHLISECFIIQLTFLNILELFEGWNNKKSNIENAI